MTTVRGPQRTPPKDPHYVLHCLAVFFLFLSLRVFRNCSLTHSIILAALATRFRRLIIIILGSFLHISSISKRTGESTHSRRKTGSEPANFYHVYTCHRKCLLEFTAPQVSRTLERTPSCLEWIDRRYRYLGTRARNAPR